MHNRLAGDMDQGLQFLETSMLSARVEALTPCALASFVNGKFNSAGVDGRLWRSLSTGAGARGTKLQAYGLSLRGIIRFCCR